MWVNNKRGIMCILGAGTGRALSHRVRCWGSPPLLLLPRRFSAQEFSPHFFSPLLSHYKSTAYNAKSPNRASALPHHSIEANYWISCVMANKEPTGRVAGWDDDGRRTTMTAARRGAAAKRRWGVARGWWGAAAVGGGGRCCAGAYCAANARRLCYQPLGRCSALALLLLSGSSSLFSASHDAVRHPFRGATSRRR